MDSKELREKFINFFTKRGHKHLPAAGLIPKDDPSVLFTTAGMQQFKKFYTHPEEAPAQNVVTCQPCFRTSDIEEVGDDTHLTFFEMLGNFSFGYPKIKGSYFKKEAIKMAYEFLTDELGIEPQRIYCSIFAGDKKIARDDESAEILQNMNIKFSEYGREDNFWSLGTEGSAGGPTVEFYVDEIEVWNVVFNEYVFKNGKYESSQYRGVDTGMGFERMLVVLNNLKDVYETDLFLSIIKKIEEISKKKYQEFRNECRIIVDHLKAATFLINDGISPSNKEREYIVRRLIRRAIVKGTKLEFNENFTSKIAQTIFELYSKVYDFKKEEIENVLNTEEVKFRKTLQAGLKLIHSKEQIIGNDLFDLYQSFGIPSEIVEEEARETQIQIAENAEEEFKKLFQKHQELSRTASAGMFKGGLVVGGEMETKYHTATHLLHSALREVLGKEVLQKGSNITAERLRFDFSYPDKLTDEQIKKVEDIVNGQIKKDVPVEMQEITLEEAKKKGAIGVFEDKYGDKVKIYTINDFSCELCGGPHVKSTGVLGHFKITKEESSSAGIRRIKATLN